MTREDIDLKPVSWLGSAIAAKTACMHASPLSRELLLFLHSFAVEEGGWQRLVSDILQKFSDRLVPVKASHDLVNRHLYQLLKELCFDPLRALVDPGQDEAFVSHYRNEAIEAHLVDVDVSDAHLTSAYSAACDYPKVLREFGRCELRGFRNVVDALHEYKEWCEKQAPPKFVLTRDAKRIIEVLDYSLETRKCALIRGGAGFGKSAAVAAWCGWHRGDTRYARLSGIANKLNFFRRLSKACGLPDSEGLSPNRLQARVEDYLRKTRVLLIIDEGQYAWQQTRKINREPELVNWLLTDCFNVGVPVVLSATLEFDNHRRDVEQQTHWASEQFSRRFKRAVILDTPPLVEDLEAVAARRADYLPTSAIKYIAGYALTSKRYFDGVNEVIDDAQMIAEKDGRQKITRSDLLRAIEVFRMPSDGSLKRVLPRNEKGPRSVTADGPPAGCRGVAAPPQRASDDQDFGVPNTPVGPRFQAFSTG